MIDYQKCWLLLQKWLGEEINHCAQQQEQYRRIYRETENETEWNTSRMFAHWKEVHEQTVKQMQEIEFEATEKADEKRHDE